MGDLAADQAQLAARERGLGTLTKLLEDRGIDLSQVGDVRAIRLNEWQAMSKDADGEPVVTDLHAASIVLSPGWEAGPAWPVVDRAAPVKVTVPKATPRSGSWKTCCILPDIQFGYRRLMDGSLDAFHDEAALAVALQIVEHERPDLTVFLGDVLDLAPLGRYRYEAGFAMTVQPAVDRAHSFIAQVSALSGETRYISGNHDVRLQHYITDNALAAFGLKRGGAAPAEWPVLSVPYLLNLDELGVEYVGSYPAGATYINDNLACIHGAKIGNRSRTAAQLVAEDERVSVIYGHTHKRALAAKTRNTRGQPKFSLAYSPGCLCRVDGGVPSVKGGVDAFGRPIRAWEDWQQGVGVVRYEEGDGRFSVEDVPIFEGWAMHRGLEFAATRVAVAV